HDAEPELNGEFSFHGMTITGNIFFSSGAAPWFRYITIKPYGPDHYINGLTISDNLFKQTAGQKLDRVEMVDATLFPLDVARTRGLVMSGNTFHNIVQPSGDPVTVKIASAIEQSGWEIDLAGRLPFDGQANTVLAAVPEGPITGTTGAPVFTLPYATTAQGPNDTVFRLNWSEVVKGTVVTTVSSNAL
ncbi:MAG: right-handed parallel beta-helix repeat-containing protein, partial [Pseudomonadota bacterium]